MSSEDVSNYRRKRKINLMEVLGNKCCLCGYNKIPNSLEFHHINPNEKSFGIADNGICRDLETDLAEIKKCILVCANCHREIHANLYTQNDLIEKQIYNEDIANELREEKKKFLEKTLYFCTNCGKQLYQKSLTGLCAECYAKTNRVVERPNREELKDLIRKFPFTQIGKLYGVTDNAIRKWCDAEKLPRKKREIDSYSDDQWAKI